MSIVVKKIGGNEYAYHAYRVGEKVVHKYLGPAAAPAVAAHRARLLESSCVPERFRPLFWDADPAGVDIHRHATYIIERVLELGNLDAVYWIQRIYPAGRIIQTCMTSRKISPKSRALWDVWFGAPCTSSV